MPTVAQITLKPISFPIRPPIIVLITFWEELNVKLTKLVKKKNFVKISWHSWNVTGNLLQIRFLPLTRQPLLRLWVQVKCFFQLRKAPSPPFSENNPLYRQQLSEIRNEGLNTIYVDFNHLYRFDDVLANAIADNFYR